MRISKKDLPFPERVARVWGGLNEMARTDGDADLAVADFFQVTQGQLRAWLLAEGRHRCPCTTTRGHGCRNYASAVIDYDPRVWVSRDPGYCPMHLRSPRRPAAAAGRPQPATAVEDDASVAAR